MLPRLKSMLGEPKDRGAKVELFIEVPGGTVKLALPGCYAISAPQLLQLQALEGVMTKAA